MFTKYQLLYVFLLDQANQDCEQCVVNCLYDLFSNMLSNTFCRHGSKFSCTALLAPLWTDLFVVWTTSKSHKSILYVRPHQTAGMRYETPHGVFVSTDGLLVGEERLVALRTSYRPILTLIKKNGIIESRPFDWMYYVIFLNKNYI